MGRLLELMDSRLYNLHNRFFPKHELLLTNAQSPFQRFLGEELVVNAPDLVVNGPDLVVNAPGFQLTFFEKLEVQFFERKLKLKNLTVS